MKAIQPTSLLSFNLFLCFIQVTRLMLFPSDSMQVPRSSSWPAWLQCCSAVRFLRYEVEKGLRAVYNLTVMRRQSVFFPVRFLFILCLFKFYILIPLGNLTFPYNVDNEISHLQCCGKRNPAPIRLLSGQILIHSLFFLLLQILNILQCW